jgi:hypothetical protein
VKAGDTKGTRRALENGADLDACMLDVNIPGRPNSLIYPITYVIHKQYIDVA